MACCASASLVSNSATLFITICRRSSVPMNNHTNSRTTLTKSGGFPAGTETVRQISGFLCAAPQVARVARSRTTTCPTSTLKRTLLTSSRGRLLQLTGHQKSLGGSGVSDSCEVCPLGASSPSGAHHMPGRHFQRLRGAGSCLLPRRCFFSDDPGSNDVPRKGILTVAPTRCNRRRGTGVWRVPSSSRGMSETFGNRKL